MGPPNLHTYRPHIVPRSVVRVPSFEVYAPLFKLKIIDSSSPFFLVLQMARAINYFVDLEIGRMFKIEFHSIDVLIKSYFDSYLILSLNSKK